jgi:hypothetical protein
MPRVPAAEQHGKEHERHQRRRAATDGSAPSPDVVAHRGTRGAAWGIANLRPCATRPRCTGQ